MMFNRKTTILQSGKATSCHLDLCAVVHALGGETTGGNRILAPGPCHSSQDRSLSVMLDPYFPDGFLVYSFAGDDPMACRDHVRLRLGLPTRSPFYRHDDPRQSTMARPLSDADEKRRTGQSMTIWHEARDPRGTPVEAYLNRRGLDLPDGAADGAVRFHPACPFAGQRTPAMVCLVRDIVTSEPKAIHRTALTHDGRKTKITGKDRLALGPIAGAAIKLTPDEAVTLCLGIGEGIESTLSMRNLPEFGHSPVWSLISAGGIATLPVLSGIESLWLAVDHDETGIRAARSTARRWQASGAEAFLITPSTPSADLNDLFIAGAHNA